MKRIGLLLPVLVMVVVLFGGIQTARAEGPLENHVTNKGKKESDYLNVVTGSALGLATKEFEINVPIGMEGKKVIGSTPSTVEDNEIISVEASRLGVNSFLLGAELKSELEIGETLKGYYRKNGETDWKVTEEFCINRYNPIHTSYGEGIHYVALIDKLELNTEYDFYVEYTNLEGDTSQCNSRPDYPYNAYKTPDQKDGDGLQILEDSEMEDKEAGVFIINLFSDKIGWEEDSKVVDIKVYQYRVSGSEMGDEYSDALTTSIIDNTLYIETIEHYLYSLGEIMPGKCYYVPVLTYRNGDGTTHTYYGKTYKYIVGDITTRAYVMSTYGSRECNSFTIYSSFSEEIDSNKLRLMYREQGTKEWIESESYKSNGIDDTKLYEYVTVIDGLKAGTEYEYYLVRQKEISGEICTTGKFVTNTVPVIDPGSVDDNGRCGVNAIWSYNETTKVLTISGTGPIDDRVKQDSSTSYTKYYDGVEEIVIKTGITAIGASAFQFFNSLKKVTIEEGVKTIHKSAFVNCRMLEKVLLPETLEVIEDDAFYLNTGLKSIHIPKNVRSIGIYSLSYLQTLIDFSVDPENQYYTYENGILYTKDMKTAIFGFPMLLPDDVVIPEGVDTIGIYVLNSSKIKTVLLPASLTAINPNTFGSTDNLQKIDVNPANTVYVSKSGMLCTKDNKLVVIPGSITGCLVIPDGITEICDFAVNNNDYITEVKIPASVEKMSAESFHICHGLKKFVVDEENQKYKSMDGFVYSKDGSRLIIAGDGFGDVLVIPEGVKEIAENAIQYKFDLLIVELPSTLELIEKDAFFNCFNLKKVFIKSGSVSMKDCFGACLRLTDIVVDGEIDTLYPYLLNSSTSILYSNTVKANCEWINELQLNGDKVYFKDEWYRASFSRDGHVISSEIYLAAQPFTVPEASLTDKASDETYSYRFLGWDINRDRKVDTLPSRINQDIEAVAVYRSTLLNPPVDPGIPTNPSTPSEPGIPSSPSVPSTQDEQMESEAAVEPEPIVFEDLKTETENGQTDSKTNKADTDQQDTEITGETKEKKPTVKTATIVPQAKVKEEAGKTIVESTVSDAQLAAIKEAVEKEVEKQKAEQNDKDKETEEPVKIQINLKLPSDDVVNQMKDKNVTEIVTSMTVPSDFSEKTGAELGGIVLPSNVLDGAAENKKDVTVELKDEKGNLQYAWSFPAEELAGAGEKKDINLKLDIVTPDDKVLQDVPEETKKTISENKGIVLNFGHSGELPATATVKVNVSGQKLKPGDTVHMYFYNDVTGMVEELPNSTYLVGADGCIDVAITHCSSYLVVGSRLEQAVSIKEQITITEQVKLYIGGTTGFACSVKPSAPASIVLVTKKGINKNAAKEEVVVKYSSSNKKIATVDKNGLVTAKKEGNVSIKIKLTFSDGSKKELITNIVVSKAGVILLTKDEYSKLTETSNPKQISEEAVNLTLGEKEEFIAVLNGVDAKGLYWMSKRSEKATVGKYRNKETAVVSAKTMGDDTLLLYGKDGLLAERMITITEASKNNKQEEMGNK